MSIALLPPDQQDLMRHCLELVPPDQRAATAERLDAAIADHYRNFPEESDFAARVLTYRIEEAFDGPDAGEYTAAPITDNPSTPIPF